MIEISKLAYETLKDKNGNLSHNPIDWWKKINGRVVGVYYV